jgi:putative zinc finger protein
MTRCLDEAMLQGYFDGELSGEMMERATLHLAVCSTCAAAAREMEEEIHLLATALAPELDARVPTEQLRKRIDAAVSDLRVGAASSSRERAGFGAFISSLLSFGTQRTLGYASLVMLLAFAAIFGLVKLRTAPEQSQAQQQQQQQAQQLPQHQPQDQVAANSPSVSSVPSVFKTEPQKNTDRPYKAVKVTHRSVSAPVAAAAPAPEQVKLLPGERAYLQTIARLDSTIKANQKAMRPSLQFEYERNLAVVDRAIAATRSAAKKTPNDPDTADFMFAAYQSKVDLLNTIADARLGGGRSH